MGEDNHRSLMEKIEKIVHENKGTFLTFTEETSRPKSEHIKPALNLVLCGRRGAGKTSAAKAILGQTEFDSVSNPSECVKHQGDGVWTLGFPGGAACLVWKTSGGSDGGIIQVYLHL
ncbi:hypothetical protein L3Q82_007004 [Scortum barcoo]|uniref:Uncharacterized protein n=1 Tax=Scortum barcoo TaxID=214431 RepID=A0ACB8WXF2_9TELE|nr:hypothetical protein L3Q82_007004 [Scortum barcoo]